MSRDDDNFLNLQIIKDTQFIVNLNLMWVQVGNFCTLNSFTIIILIEILRELVYLQKHLILKIEKNMKRK